MPADRSRSGCGHQKPTRSPRKTTGMKLEFVNGGLLSPVLRNRALTDSGLMRSRGKADKNFRDLGESVFELVTE
jgi:hypothetical protein